MCRKMPRAAAKRRAMASPTVPEPKKTPPTGALGAFLAREFYSIPSLRKKILAALDIGSKTPEPQPSTASEDHSDLSDDFSEDESIILSVCQLCHSAELGPVTELLFMWIYVTCTCYSARKHWGVFSYCSCSLYMWILLVSHKNSLYLFFLLLLYEACSRFSTYCLFFMYSDYNDFAN